MHIKISKKNSRIGEEEEKRRCSRTECESFRYGRQLRRDREEEVKMKQI